MIDEEPTQDKEPTQEEREEAKASVEAAAESVKERLSQPGAEAKYGGPDSVTIERLPSGWWDMVQERTTT